MPALELRDLGIGRLFWAIREAAIVGDLNDSHIKFWNPAAAQLFGYSESEAIGMPLEHLVPESLRAAHRAGLARYRATGRGRLIDDHATVEMPALRKDGKVITIELSLSPLAIGEAKRDYVVALIRDVSDRSRAEAALQQSEARFAAFMDNGIAEAFVKDADGRYEYVNRQFARHFGVTQEGVRGKSDAELWPAEMARLVREHDLAVLAQDRMVETLETDAPSDGPRRHWSVHKFPFRDAAGRRLLGGMAIDISDQVRQRERREALLRVARELAAETDTDRILDTILAETVAILGASAATVYRWDPALGILAPVRVIGDAGAIGPARPGEGATGRAFAERAPAIVNDYGRAEGAMASWVATGVQAAMSAPLLHEGRLLGTLSVASRAAGATFGSEDAELLEVLTGIAATVLVGAERAALLRGMAETDALTGLANRRKAVTVLEHFLGLCHRHNQTLAFGILDLDHFKQVNDRHGHAAGDEVLRRVAHLLQQSFRGEDVVARWGARSSRWRCTPVPRPTARGAWP